MNKRIVVSLCVCCLVLGTVTLVSAERTKPAEKIAAEGQSNARVETSGPAVKPLDQAVQTKASKGRAIGMIKYDDGVVTAAPAVTSNCYGNQFNTAAGSPVNASGSVTKMQMFMAGVGGSAAFVSVFGPVAGTAAPALESVNVPVAPGTWNTHTFATPVAYTGASFLAGVWFFGGDSVGLGSGTAGGQGHHGMLINDIAGTGFAPLTSLNALVTASGDVLVPDELMSFSIE